MLFNSYAFLVAFLPVTLIGYFYFARVGQLWATAWLCSASFFFYGWCDYRYLPLLSASILVNFWAGERIRSAVDPARRRWLAAAISINLALLAYYKYAGFFLDAVSSATGHTFPTLSVVLPIGISFFTFTQIAYLVDTAQGKVGETRLLHYGLFVTYFPHLIAGPVLHHKEMMPQFADRSTSIFSSSNFAVGSSIFFIGLAKKVLLADNLAPYASQLFDQPGSPSLLIAWGGVLAYTFQLYFDFSGYSDMAIGLSRLFGVSLPINFSSPYKASNIIDFWRRWHMTLSRFLRDYLYIAMGGSRHGTPRRLFNLMTTMVLGGLWHGAGWTFVLWGTLHGSYLVVNHAWLILAKRMRFPVESASWRGFAVVLTFVAVCFAWVLFRAPDITVAGRIMHGMTGGFGIGLPLGLANRLGGLRSSLEGAGVTFFLGGGARFIETWGWVMAAAAVTFLAPNTQQIMRRFSPALDFDTAPADGWSARWLQWLPSRRWALFVAVLAVCSLLTLNRPSEFLYFQF